MSFETQGFGEKLPADEVLAVASAYADRLAYIEGICEVIAAEVQGKPVNDSPEHAAKMHAKHLERTMLRMRQLEEPDAVITQHDFFMASVGGYEGLHAEVEGKNIPDEIGFDRQSYFESREALDAEVREKTGIDEDYEREKFQNQFLVAKELAEEQGITLVEVYASDDLFRQVCARAIPLEESIEKSFELMDAIDHEEMQKQIATSLINAMQPGEGIDAITEEEITLLSMMIQVDPNLQAYLAESVEISQEVLRQVLLWMLVYDYGQDVLSHLSDDQLKQLLPKRALAKPLLDALNA